jgi:hypothetical protein
VFELARYCIADDAGGISRNAVSNSRSPFHSSLSEVPASHFKPEGISELFQREAAVDDRTDRAAVQRPDDARRFAR